MTPTPLRLDAELPTDALRDRVILVTGASRGLGRAIALDCARRGARTLLAGRDVRRLEAVADEIEALAAPEPVIVPINLEGASLDDYTTLATLVAERCGRLDGLVLNAAMLGEICGIETSDPVLWARVFQVNVHSPYLMVRALLPLLRQAEAASIIATSSGVGRQGRALWGAYAASKHALEGLMQVLADELRGVSTVRINSLNPGRTRTRMRAQAYPAEDPATLPAPEEIAPFFVQLLTGRDGFHGEALEIALDKS